jgi:hypothetical protein
MKQRFCIVFDLFGHHFMHFKNVCGQNNYFNLIFKWFGISDSVAIYPLHGCLKLWIEH